jgi:glucose-1-phosphate cytidylyltransferase
MKVVILAGGKGTRISEESHLRPKPMIEIGDAPILWHILKIYSHFGFNDFIICCGYKEQMIKEYFANYYLHRSDITFDFSADNKMIVHSNIAEPWKVTLVNTGMDTMTGGRIRRVKRYVEDEPFMMTYGDGVSDINIPGLLEQHKGSGNVITLSATLPSGRFGILEIDGKGKSVIGFQEKAQETNSWINAGFMVMKPEVFDYLDNDYTILERSPLERLSAEGRLGVYKHSGFWQCMDTQRDKELLEHLWNTGIAPWKVWAD